MLYILDTDHLTLYQRNNPIVLERIRSLDYNLHDLATTIVNYHEQISGRFGQLQRANSSATIVTAYQAMKSTIEFLDNWQILDYDDRAENRVRVARKSGVRIGIMDLRIAAIALSLDATVVTRNQKDFQQVLNLKFEDWSAL
jgi:tRNA(fMet)-specific endonuclease VapC